MQIVREHCGCAPSSLRLAKRSICVGAPWTIAGHWRLLVQRRASRCTCCHWLVGLEAAFGHGGLAARALLQPCPNGPWRAGCRATCGCAAARLLPCMTGCARLRSDAINGLASNMSDCERLSVQRQNIPTAFAHIASLAMHDHAGTPIPVLTTGSRSGGCRWTARSC